MSNSEDYLDGLLNSISETKTQVSKDYEEAAEKRNARLSSRTRISPDENFMEASGIEGFKPVEMKHDNLRKAFSESEFLKEFEAELDGKSADDFLKDFDDALEREQNGIKDDIDEELEKEGVASSFMKSIQNVVDQVKGGKKEEELALDVELPEKELKEALDDLIIEDAFGSLIADDAVGEVSEEEPMVEMAQESSTGEELVLDIPDLDSFSTEPEVNGDVDVLPEIDMASEEQSIDSLLEGSMDIGLDLSDITDASEPAIDGVPDLSDLPGGADMVDLGAELGLENDLGLDLGADLGIEGLDLGGDGLGLDLDLSLNFDELTDTQDEPEAADENEEVDTPSLEEGETEKKSILDKIKGLLNFEKLRVLVFGEYDEEDLAEIAEMEQAKANGEKVSFLPFLNKKKKGEEKPAEEGATEGAEDGQNSEGAESPAAMDEADVDEAVEEDKKKKKKEKKPKKEKAPKEPDTSPKVPMKVVIIFVLLAISVVVLMIIFTNITGKQRALSECRSAFNDGKYVEAFEQINGVELTKDDEKLLQKKTRLLANLQQSENEFIVFMEMESYPEALDSLIQALGRYRDLSDEAKELGIESEYNALGDTLKTLLANNFGMSYEAALTLYDEEDRYEYTVKILKVLDVLELGD